MITTALTLLLVLIGLSIPVGAALGALGMILDPLYSMLPLTGALGEITWSTSTEFLLVAIPLFIMLGEILLRSGMAERIMNNPSMPDDVALESKIVSRAIESAQAQVEGVNAEQRKNVLKYDDVMNRQREAIYTDRRAILEGDDLEEKVGHFLEDVVKAMVTETTQVGNPDDWDLKQLWTNLKQLYPIGISMTEVIDEAELLRRVGRGS